MVFLLNQINQQKLAYGNYNNRSHCYLNQDDIPSESISIRTTTVAPLEKDASELEETNSYLFGLNDDDIQITISSSSCESSESHVNMSSDDTTDSNSDPDQSSLRLITQICSEITGQHVNRTLSIFGDLTQNPALWEYLINSLCLVDLVNNRNDELEFATNLSKLMFCLNLVEREFAWFCAFDSEIYFLDGIFMLNVIFLLYEQSESQLMEVKRPDSDMTAVFDLDLSETVDDFSSEITFQQLVESNLKLLKKYLPAVIQINSQKELLERASGKDILKQLRGFLNKKNCDDIAESECSYFLPQNLSNIEEALFTPLAFESEANPISKSYKPLVHNLKALSFLTYDPFREADEFSAHFGTEVNICTLGCLSFSYLTMGQFSAKKCLFENSNQFLHELKSFYHEFECVFDDNELNEQKFKQTSKYKESMNGEQPTEKSKWDYTEKFSRLPESEKKLSLLDEILDRISSINEYGPQLDKSNDWHINTNSSHSETKETSNFSRNWTVAPKLFPTNTIGYSCAQQNGISYSPDTSDLKTCRVYTDSKNKKNNWNSKSTELRPIGTKSASMSSIRNGYQNRHAFMLNESPVQSQPNVACKEISKNVWNHDSSEKETFSNSSFSSIGLPYTFYSSEDSCALLSQATNFDCSAKQSHIYKANSNTNKTTASLANNGKYSVAPLGFHAKSIQGQQYHQKSGHQSYRRQSINTFSGNGSQTNSSPLTPIEDHSPQQTQRKYHNSFSNQYDESSQQTPTAGQQVNQPVHQNRHSVRGNYNQRNFPSKPNHQGSSGRPAHGKTVYNSDAFASNGSFKSGSFGEGTSFPPKNRSSRR